MCQPDGDKWPSMVAITVELARILPDEQQLNTQSLVRGRGWHRQQEALTWGWKLKFLQATIHSLPFCWSTVVWCCCRSREEVSSSLSWRGTTKDIVRLAQEINQQDCCLKTYPVNRSQSFVIAMMPSGYTEASAMGETWGSESDPHAISHVRSYRSWAEMLPSSL